MIGIFLLSIGIAGTVLIAIRIYRLMVRHGPIISDLFIVNDDGTSVTYIGNKPIKVNIEMKTHIVSGGSGKVFFTATGEGD